MRPKSRRVRRAQRSSASSSSPEAAPTVAWAIGWASDESFVGIALRCVVHTASMGFVFREHVAACFREWLSRAFSF